MGEKENYSVSLHYARSLEKEESRAGIINSTSNSDDHQWWQVGSPFLMTPSSILLHSSPWASQVLEDGHFGTGVNFPLCMLLHSWECCRAVCDPDQTDSPGAHVLLSSRAGLDRPGLVHDTISKMLGTFWFTLRDISSFVIVVKIST